MDKLRRRTAGRLFFGDWSMSDPDYEPLRESMYTARYALHRLTQADAYRILAAAEAYLHLAAHPAPTHMLIAQLRAVRKVVREETPDPGLSLERTLPDAR